MRAILDSEGYPYLLSVPPPAAAEPGRWPLILFLHGAGERGTSLADVTRQGLPKLLAAGPELTEAERALGKDIAERFIVVAPQCAPFEVWDDAALLALLACVDRGLNVDPARVYLTGLSMGGFGAWSLGMRQPQRFAALAPICGGGRVADVAAAATRESSALRSLGVWAFHGALDIIVPLEESTRMIDALQQAGVLDVRITVYPEVGHDAWTPSYGNPELYTWLLAHRR